AGAKRGRGLLELFVAEHAGLAGHATVGLDNAVHLEGRVHGAVAVQVAVRVGEEVLGRADAHERRGAHRGGAAGAGRIAPIAVRVVVGVVHRDFERLPRRVGPERRVRGALAAGARAAGAAVAERGLDVRRRRARELLLDWRDRALAVHLFHVVRARA